MVFIIIDGDKYTNRFSSKQKKQRNIFLFLISIGRKMWNQFHFSLTYAIYSTLNISCISYGNY